MLNDLNIEMIKTSQMLTLKICVSSYDKLILVKAQGLALDLGLDSTVQKIILVVPHS